MTNTVQTKPLQRAPMTSSRKSSLAAGVLYLITFVSMPTIGLYAAVHTPNFIAGNGPDGPVILGGLLEIIVALANIGTAVALFPVLKRQNEAVALGFVGARVLEASTMFAGVASLFAIVTLRQAGVGADGLVTGQTLVALHDSLKYGQAIMPVVNALLLGYLLFRSRLVPRILPILAFVGAPILLASTIATMLGLVGAESAVTALGALPDALWEFSLGIYLVVKGFKPSPITAEFDK
jgi:Domain of unknown function (DUF4386)